MPRKKKKKILGKLAKQQLEFKERVKKKGEKNDIPNSLLLVPLPFLFLLIPNYNLEVRELHFLSIYFVAATHSVLCFSLFLFRRGKKKSLIKIEKHISGVKLALPLPL